MSILPIEKRGIPTLTLIRDDKGNILKMIIQLDCQVAGRQEGGLNDIHNALLETCRMALIHNWVEGGYPCSTEKIEVIRVMGSKKK